MKIPFTKAHGAHNDFLLTWRDRLPPDLSDFAAAAVAICDRHTGAGADGWLLLTRGGGDVDATIDLWNSDGSRSEMSGNGTRCAAALLIEAGCAPEQMSIATGAGLKRLRLLQRRGPTFFFEMNMGRAVIEELHATAEGRGAVILNVGNPQCAVLVEHFNFDWQAVGARLSRDRRFANGSNISFVRVIDRHAIDVRFFERGAGETMSSGTGSTGAAAAVRARGLVETPVRVLTPAGPLGVRWDGEDILLTGPAEIVAAGEFYWEGKQP